MYLDEAFFLLSEKFRPQDIAKALLRMISNDIGQV